MEVGEKIGDETGKKGHEHRSPGPSGERTALKKLEGTLEGSYRAFLGKKGGTENDNRIDRTGKHRGRGPKNSILSGEEGGSPKTSLSERGSGSSKNFSSIGSGRRRPSKGGEPVGKKGGKGGRKKGKGALKPGGKKGGKRGEGREEGQ